MKLNNYYLILWQDSKWYDFTSDGGNYMLSSTREINLEQEALVQDHYQVNGIYIYICAEPLTMLNPNEAANGKSRLLRNLPKHFIGLTKYNLEPIIKDIKSK